MNTQWKEIFRLTPVLALLVLTPPISAYTSQAQVNEAWPMCRDWTYQIEPWQVIRPSSLTAARAERALTWLSEHEDEQIHGEAHMILTGNLQILEGYALRTRMRHDVRRSGRDAVTDFCKWITTTSFPE